MKKLIAVVGVLGIADFFVYGINDLTLHSARIEDIALVAALVIGAVALYSMLYVIDREEKEQEEKSMEQWINTESRRAVMEFLYGKDEACGHNLPAKKHRIQKGA